MSGVSVVTDRREPRLEEAVLAALEAAGARRPSRLPRCPVCGGAMRSCGRPGDLAEARCVDCASVIADAAPVLRDSSQLRLVS